MSDKMENGFTQPAQGRLLYSHCVSRHGPGHDATQNNTIRNPTTIAQVCNDR